jgi:peptidoglycan/xylan/chitin deacetylase (PgdA/CDA1 family)
MLHRIRPGTDDGGEVLTTGQLGRSLAYLKEQSYTVLSLAEYVKALTERRETYKAVVFTIDDGYRDVYTSAYPVFQQFAYPFTVFLVSDFIERRVFPWWNKIEYVLERTAKREIDLGFMRQPVFTLESDRVRRTVTRKIVDFCKYLPENKKQLVVDQLADSLQVDTGDQPAGKYAPLNWAEITEMAENGVDFYPHTKSHPIMSRISYDRQLEELRLSRTTLETRLRRNMDIFCYPNGMDGDFDGDTIRALRESGYIAAVTAMPGFDNTREMTDLFRLRRFAIPERLEWFKQYVSGLEAIKERFRR